MERIVTRDYRIFGRPLWSSVKTNCVQMSLPLFDEQKEAVIRKLGKKPDASVLSTKKASTSRSAAGS